MCSGVPGGMAASTDHVGRETVKTKEPVRSVREGVCVGGHAGEPSLYAWAEAGPGSQS